MGKSWDDFEPKEYQEFCEEWGEQALRVLKPGGYLLAFSGTRTYHRMVVGLEDVGFEIKDQIDWITGQGFPKSTDISKQIDKHFGKEDERKVVGKKKTPDGKDYADRVPNSSEKYKDSKNTYDDHKHNVKITKPATPRSLEVERLGNRA